MPLSQEQGRTRGGGTAAATAEAAVAAEAAQWWKGSGGFVRWALGSRECARSSGARTLVYPSACSIRGCSSPISPHPTSILRRRRRRQRRGADMREGLKSLRVELGFVTGGWERNWGLRVDSEKSKDLFAK